MFKHVFTLRNILTDMLLRVIFNVELPLYEYMLFLILAITCHLKLETLKPETLTLNPRT